MCNVLRGWQVRVSKGVPAPRPTACRWVVREVVGGMEGVGVETGREVEGRGGGGGGRGWVWLG